MAKIRGAESKLRQACLNLFETLELKFLLKLVRLTFVLKLNNECLILLLDKVTIF